VTVIALERALAGSSTVIVRVAEETPSGKTADGV